LTKVNILYLVHLLRGVCIHQTSERIANNKKKWADRSNQAASSSIRKAWRTSWMERNHGECLCADKI